MSSAQTGSFRTRGTRAARGCRASRTSRAPPPPPSAGTTGPSCLQTESVNYKRIILMALFGNTEQLCKNITIFCCNFENTYIFLISSRKCLVLVYFVENCKAINNFQLNGEIHKNKIFFANQDYCVVLIKYLCLRKKGSIRRPSNSYHPCQFFTDVYYVDRPLVNYQIKI